MTPFKVKVLSTEVSEIPYKIINKETGVVEREGITYRQPARLQWGDPNGADFTSVAIDMKIADKSKPNPVGEYFVSLSSFKAESNALIVKPILVLTPAPVALGGRAA